MILMAVLPPLIGFAWYVAHDLPAKVIVFLVGLVSLPMAVGYLSDRLQAARQTADSPTRGPSKNGG